MAEICRDLISEIAAAHSTYTLQFAESDDTPAVVDRKRMGQLISNLVGNAVQHGTPSGTISVSAQEDQQRVRVEVRSEGDDLAIDLFDVRVQLNTARSRPGHGNSDFPKYRQLFRVPQR